MKLYFGGSEVPSHRKLLTEAGVKYLSLSYYGLRRKVKFARPWLLSEHYTPEQHIFLDSGCYSLNKPDSDVTEEEAAYLATSYMSFAKANIAAVDMISEFDANVLGPEWLSAMREEFYDDLGDKFLPIWHSETGRDELARLAQRYARVGILQADVSDDITSFLTKLVNDYGTKLHGVAMTRMKVMQEIPWDSVGSTSWISPQQYGDTFVWTGRELKRYPKAYKESSRKRHRGVFQENGFDVEKIQNDDTSEVLKLSIWSWQQFVANISEKDTVISPDTPTEDIDPSVETPGTEVAHQTSKRGNPRSEVEPFEPRETTMLPIMGIGRVEVTGKDAEGNETTSVREVFAPRSESMRMCDSCYLANKCPGFKAGSNCLYNIPIMINSVDDLDNAVHGLASMQLQRVMFMTMVEQVEGGYADSNTSAEIDRLARLLKQAKGGGGPVIQNILNAPQIHEGGFVSTLLGDEAGQRARQLSEPLRADRLIENVIEGEVTELPDE